MAKLNKNQVGLIVGVFFAVIHAVWALVVAVIPSALQAFLNWVFGLHFLVPIYVLTSFDILNAVLLVVVTFVCGYIFGWVFAAIWDWLAKK